MASTTFSLSTGGDGSTVTDDSNPTTGLANGGFRYRLVPAFTNIVNTAQMAVDKAAAASSSASAAAVSAASAAMTPATNATSTTSIAIGTGSKSLTVETGKNFVIGMNLIIASTVSPANTMYGQVTSYTAGSGALVTNVTQVTGSGTMAAWTVSLSGPSLPTVINELKGSAIASASTINLDTASGNFVHITGATTVTAITLASGAERTVVFDGALTLTHNATTLILPGAQDILTAVGDTMVVRGDGTGNTRVVSYTRAAGNNNIIRSTRTANVTLSPSDRGNLIDITSGTFTQLFSAASSLGSGWYCYIKNSGTGDITIPSSDGVTNWVMYPYESRLFQCDGSVFTTIILSPYRKDFTTSGTWTKPPGYSTHSGLNWSAGGSGGNTGTTVGGGGGGGCFPFTLSASDLSATETVSVGAGGAARTAGQNGLAGGNTSFGTYIVVIGGSGGFASGAGGTGGAIQNASGVATPAISTSSSGCVGFESNVGNVSAGAIYGGGTAGLTTGNPSSSIYGAGAGGNIDTGSVLRPPGTSKFGGLGGAASIAGNGTDGGVRGGGGGATQTGTLSGAGGRGELRIWGVA